MNINIIARNDCFACQYPIRSVLGSATDDNGCEFAQEFYDCQN